MKVSYPIRARFNANEKAHYEAARAWRNAAVLIQAQAEVLDFDEEVDTKIDEIVNAMYSDAIRSSEEAQGLHSVEKVDDLIARLKDEPTQTGRGEEKQTLQLIYRVARQHEAFYIDALPRINREMKAQA